MPALEAWTVNKLSVQLGIDRRELDRIIAETNLDPADDNPRARKYYVKDVFNALKYGSEKLDFTQIKAESELENIRRKRRENDLEEALVLPVQELEDTLGRVAVEIASILDTILPSIKRVAPTLTDRDLMMIEKELAKCRNSMAEIKP